MRCIDRRARTVCLKNGLFFFALLLIAFPFYVRAQSSSVWEVLVSGLSEQMKSTVLVDLKDGQHWIGRNDAADLGLDKIKLNKPNNGAYVCLCDYGSVTVLEQKAQIVLEIDMKYRQETLIDLFGKSANSMPPSQVLDAVFLNYDLRYQRQKTVMLENSGQVRERKKVKHERRKEAPFFEVLNGCWRSGNARYCSSDR